MEEIEAPLPPGTQDDRKPWDRQPGENPREFASWVIFRELGPALRTTRAVFEHKDNKVQSIETLHTTRQRHKWTQRAAAYDAHVDKIRQARSEQIRAIDDAVHIEMSRAILAKAKEGLALIDPAKIGPQYLPRMVDTAVKISHLATGNKVQVEAQKKGKTFEDEVADLQKELSQGDAMRTEI